MDAAWRIILLRGDFGGKLSRGFPGRIVRRQIVLENVQGGNVLLQIVLDGNLGELSGECLHGEV